jgi:hypothetical protein
MGYIPTMPSIRILSVVIICLAPLVVWAQNPAPDQAPAPAPTPPAVAAPATQPAELHLDYCTNLVRQMERSAVKIEMDVDMLNQKFSLDGNYFKDTGHRIRLQLNLNGLGDTKSKMLQVCDGKVLWDFQQVLSMESYHKRDISPILKKLEDPVLDEGFRVMIISNMGFGGPEAMLAGLRKAVGFDQMADEKLMGVGGPEGLDVVVLRGTWRDRSGLLGPNERPLPPTASLPPYIPSNVAIYLGKFNGWPYKIELIGKAPLLLEDTRAIDPATNRPIGRAMKPPKVEPTHVTLRYTLLPTTEISAGLFKFEAPATVAATSVKDDTEEYLAMLDQVISVETQKKKAEAAKAEGEQPLFKTPLEVPTPPAGGGLGTAPPADGSQPK